MKLGSALLVATGLAVAQPAVAPAQRSEPLRKTDLIRLLASGTLSKGEIADLVGRNCLTFTPTARDRQNLVALGADSIILRRIDGCARRAAARAPVRPVAPPARAPSPVRTDTVAPPGSLTVVPLASRVSAGAGGEALVAMALKRGRVGVPGVRLVLRGSAVIAGSAGRDVEATTDARGIASFHVSVGMQPHTYRLVAAAVDGTALAGQPEVELVAVAPAAEVAQAEPPPSPPTTRPASARTGFISGNGQRGVVGQRAALPLVLDVRDSTGAPVAGIAVAMTAENGRAIPSAQRTDSSGQLRADVVFGERVAPTLITVVIGGEGGGRAIVRLATLFPSAGPAARLVAAYKDKSVDGSLVLDPDTASTLRVRVQDAFGNPVPSPGEVVAAVADDTVLRVVRVRPDTAGTGGVGGGRWGGGGALVTLKPGRPGGARTNLMLQAGSLRLDLSASVAARP